MRLILEDTDNLNVKLHHQIMTSVGKHLKCKDS